MARQTDRNVDRGGFFEHELAVDELPTPVPFPELTLMMLFVVALGTQRLKIIKVKRDTCVLTLLCCQVLLMVNQISRNIDPFCETPLAPRMIASVYRAFLLPLLSPIEVSVCLSSHSCLLK